MKTKIILAAIICILFFLNTSAQDNSQNYISIHTKTDSLGLNELVEIQYFDGLGRPVQKTLKSITPTGKDLVTKIEYDYCGRVIKNWLPCPLESSVEFINITNYSNSSKQFYGDNRPYTENKYYEGSWYDKVIGEQMPGADLGSHFKTINRYPNLQNSIIKFIIKNGILERSGYYAEKTLIYTSVTDEDGIISLEYKDKLDRVIMKRSDSNVDTYFIYNDLGQLTYVIPPIAADNLKNFAENTPITDSNDYLRKYCYLYKYDERGNCVEKRLPGCDPIYMVYDKADRLVLSQDGNQRKTYAGKQKKEWTVTTYDALGRVVYTGIIKNDSSRLLLKEALKNVLVTETYNSSSTFNNTGYTCSSIPSVIIRVKPIMVNYYDNYCFLDLPVNASIKSNLVYADMSGYDVQYGNAKGLLTGTRTYMLDNQLSYATSALYYDFKGQVVQSRTRKYLGGYDKVYYVYDFTGKVINSLTEHSIASFTNGNETYTYSYDNAGRPTTITYKYSVFPAFTLVSNTYDELGRLTGKSRHKYGNETTFSDAEQYSYNIRNWTTGIKSGTFEEKLYYNALPSPFTVQFSPYYNGNISASTWTYNNNVNGYGYYYDNLNRLTGTYAYLNNEMQVDYQNSEWFTYDKQGNIKFLSRFDNSDYTDQLTLTYDGNQVINIHDQYTSRNQYSIKEYQDKAQNGFGSSVVEMSYDANGNLTKDLDRNIVTIKYNLLNLPDTIQFSTGNVIINHYSAGGQKIRTDNYTRLTSITPVGEGAVVNPEKNFSDAIYSYTGTAYIDNKEYSIYKTKAQGYGGIWYYSDVFTPLRMYNAEGYVDNMNASLSTMINNGVRYNYYRRDHLGNVREVWNAVRKNYSGTVKEAAATRQRTQYYASGLPWASNTGDNPSIQRNKYNGKEFVEMHGLDETDLGNRGLYHATNRFTSIDRFCEKYPWQSPYCFAANNPVMNIDINGDSAWSVKREWNESDQKGFAQYAEKRLKEYEGKKVDCADLALNVLIDYASENGLALEVSTADGRTFDSNSDNYNSVSEFKNGYKEEGKKALQGGVLPNVQAKDISSNTFTLNKKDAQAGDMIILTKPFDHIANFSQTSPTRKLTYGNLDGGKPAPVVSSPDWSNSTADRAGRPMIYNPNRKVVHRWKALNF